MDAGTTLLFAGIPAMNSVPAYNGSIVGPFGGPQFRAFGEEKGGSHATHISQADRLVGIAVSTVSVRCRRGRGESGARQAAQTNSAVGQDPVQGRRADRRGQRDGGW